MITYCNTVGGCLKRIRYTDRIAPGIDVALDNLVGFRIKDPILVAILDQIAWCGEYI